MGPLRRIRFEFRVARAWIFLALERIGLARDMDNGDKPAADNNFTLTGSQALSDEFSPLKLMRICLDENDRRFAGYDRRLLRPTTTPALARLALRLGPALAGFAQRLGKMFRGKRDDATDQTSGLLMRKAISHASVIGHNDARVDRQGPNHGV